MTKKELLEMIKNYDDNATLMFVTEAYDRDGYPYDRAERIYKVVTTNAKRVTKDYGIERYEEA